jgi:hypothetical protein
MEKNDLKNITIQQYINMLKTGETPELANEIGEYLSSKVEGITGGFDLQLFQLQKDMLLYQCKYLLAMFDFDSKKMKIYQDRIDTTRFIIEKKTAKSNKSTPYESFLQWLLSLKKYYGSDINTSQDLTYLIFATKQMMSYYRTQEQQIEQQKQNRK